MNVPGATLRKRLLILLAIVGAALIAFYVSRSPNDPADAGKTELVIWGIFRSEGWDKRIAKYEELNPDVKLIISTGAGQMDNQKLMCAVAGGKPPDVINQDRFAVGGWAAKGAFLPLDDLIARDKGERDAIVKDDFYPACWDEAVYEGKVYAIPATTDARLLFYNEDILRREGKTNPDGSIKPPKNWDELKQYAIDMTHVDAQGHILQVGFIPMYGNSWLYLYGWQNGGEFLSPDGRKCTLNDPKIVEALDWVTGVYNETGGVKNIDGYTSAFQEGDMDPFITGKIAMMVSGNWILANIAQYKPDLHFGVVPAPVPQWRLDAAKKDPSIKPYITWSGGFSWAIPKGAAHQELAWKFIRWISSLEAGRLFNDAESRYNMSRGRRYVPLLSPRRSINDMVLREFMPKDKRFADGFKAFVDMLPASRFRPVTPVGQVLWDEHARATDQARHVEDTGRTAKEALDEAAASVQKELDKKVYEPLNLVAAGILVVGVILLAIGVFVWRAVRHMRKYARGPTRREGIVGYLFIAPWLIGFLVFTAGPILASLVLSFCSYDVLHPAEFVGLDNYVALPSDSVFWHSLTNTLWMVGAVPLGMAVGLGVALLLNMNVGGQKFYRTAYYLPAIVPIVAAAILWIWLLQPQFGVINEVLRWLDIPGVINGIAKFLGIEIPWNIEWLRGPKWLQDPNWSKPAFILMGLWSAGAGMIIWLAGLKGIPREMYEAAEIDGAGVLSRFKNITLPMLSPYIFFNLIMGIIGAFQIFTNAYVMTNGEGTPVDSTLFYVFNLFNQAFRYFHMGPASAMAWILFVIILVLTMINWRLRKRWVFTERGDV
jgi:ABC-type sugar transport system permease subunit/ABC-type glycerol-3-phosphate transport system substrate-binding protein